MEEEITIVDSFISDWEAAKADGGQWGGRGKGGRGMARRFHGMSSQTRNVLVEDLSLAYAGKELLCGATLRLVQGRRYCLIGRNGVGKSTLLDRIAHGQLPGFPPHLVVGYVEQEGLPLPDGGVTVINWLLESCIKDSRSKLEKERQELEGKLDRTEVGEEYVAAIVERLGDIELELDETGGGAMRERATKVLSGLGFSAEGMAQDAAVQSGGWRTRVAMARALLTRADVLLLDEPTNHLDLRGVLWLETYLNSEVADECTVVVVSHDRDFLVAVGTDVIVFEDKKLNSFPAPLDEYERRKIEGISRDSALLDARVRQERHLREAAENMKMQAGKSKGSRNDGQLKQAKQKLDKIARVGLYREDGKAFHTHSVKTLDVKAVRLPSRIEALKVEKEESMSFPPCDLTVLRLGCDKASEVLLTLDNATVTYYGGVDDGPPQLQGMVAQVTLGRRIAVVGDNGCGKTTLLKLLADELQSFPLGSMKRRPGLVTAYVRQHHTEVLGVGTRPKMSAAQYLSGMFGVTELEARSRLGKFSLSGSAATTPMSALSGGQLVRVSLTALTWSSPHLLLLDEPTNHLDMGAVQALATALHDFEGSVVVVSHNRAFCHACCTDLWVVQDHKLQVMDCEDVPFAELFSRYAASLMAKGTPDSSGKWAVQRNAKELEKMQRGDKGVGSKVCKGEELGSCDVIFVCRFVWMHE